MTDVENLARFVSEAGLEDLSGTALEQLKIRVLDTVGVAIAALDGEPIAAIRNLTETLGGRPLTTLDRWWQNCARQSRLLQTAR